tara:strand:+ start:548 stop:754 length:207 start_codon:yes stop_codon:yes gene_type:complete
MSGENLAVDTSIEKRDPGASSTNPHHKVDINNLLAKLKREEKSKKKENLILVSLVISAIGITGIIASF